MRHSFGCVLTAVLSVIAVSCAKVNIDYYGENPVVLVLGESRMVSYTTEPEGVMLKWSSSNPDVVAVDEGYMMAVSIGEARITGKAQGSSISFAVKVRAVPVSAFSIPSGMTLYVGGEREIEVSNISPSNANASSLQWKSSNESVATVRLIDGKAIVSGLKSGIAEITATGESVSHSCTVIVKDSDYFLIEGVSGTIYMGFPVEVTAKQSPETYKDYSWSSDNESVVTVSGNGSKATLTPQGLGSAKVTCTAGPTSASVTVVVKNPELKISSSLDGDLAFLNSNFTVEAKMLPEGDLSDIRWTLSNNDNVKFFSSPSGNPSIKLSVPAAALCDKVSLTATSAKNNVSATYEFEIMGTDMDLKIGVTSAVPTFASTELAVNAGKSYFLNQEATYPIYMGETFIRERMSGMMEKTDFFSLFDSEGRHPDSRIMNKVEWQVVVPTKGTYSVGSSYLSGGASASGCTYCFIPSLPYQNWLYTIHACINTVSVATFKVLFGFSEIRLYTADATGTTTIEDKRLDVYEEWHRYHGLRNSAETSTSISSYRGCLRPKGFSMFGVNPNSTCRLIGVSETPTGKTCCTLLPGDIITNKSGVDQIRKKSTAYSIHYMNNGNSHSSPIYNDHIQVFEGDGKAMTVEGWIRLGDASKMGSYLQDFDVHVSVSTVYPEQ